MSSHLVVIATLISFDISVGAVDMNYYLRNPGTGVEWSPYSFGTVMYGATGLLSHSVYVLGFANP